MRYRWLSGMLLLAMTLPSGGRAQGVASDEITQNFSLKANPLAYGGAYRAVADDAGSLTLNPAGMAFYKKIDIGFNYLHSNYNNADLFSGAIYDNIDGDWALGFSYDQDALKLSGNKLGVRQFTLGLATRMFNLVAIGLTGQYFQGTGSSSLGHTPSGWSGNAGVMVRPLDYLSLAVVGYNVFMPHNRSQFPHQLGGGITLWLGEVSKISLDWLHDFSTRRQQSTNLYFGGDLRLHQVVYLRAGFGGDMIYDNPFLSTGLRIGGPKAALVVTYSNRLNPSRQTIALALDLGTALDQGTE